MEFNSNKRRDQITVDHRIYPYRFRSHKLMQAVQTTTALPAGVSTEMAAIMTTNGSKLYVMRKM
jgi:hypothetical protein